MRASVLLLSLALPLASAYSQTACPTPPASLSPTAPDIFNTQQEQDLGDAYAEFVEPRAHFVDDHPAELYLEKIGQKLLAVLPPTQLHFRYRIIDTDEINAFSIAGGHIYVTRKLIAAAKNEDEVAGVLAHEIGHILTHQQAIDVTSELAQLLRVKEVGDRDDVFDKVHRMSEMEINGNWHAPREDKEEDAADAVALYASMKAGYVPRAYTDFWDRLADTGGKTGSALGDFFHTTRPEQKRLRTMLAVERAIPPACAVTQVTVPADFSAWQKEVIAGSVRNAQTGVDSKLVQLNPPLRSDLLRLRFSPDGKYFLAQDESTIFVFDRSSVSMAFQIDAPDAESAWFSPDSTRIVFSTPSLRVEDWDIATKQRTAVHEMVIYQQCLEHLLSPDGHTLACIVDTPKSTRLGLMIWDVPSGDVLLKRDDAFIAEDDVANFDAVYFEKTGQGAASWSFTPDGTRLLLNVGTFTYLYDVQARGMVKPTGAISKLDKGPFAFVGNDRIVILSWDDPKNSGLYSFPEGKLIRHVPMGFQTVERVTRGDYLLLRPIKDASLGVLDINTDKVPITLKGGAAADIYEKTFLAETGEGAVMLTSEGLVAGAKGIVSHDLPVSLLGTLRSAALSTDGKYLAVSSSTRSAFWDLDTGQRVLHIRPFQDGYFDGKDHFLGDFSKYQNEERTLIGLDVSARKGAKMTYEPAKNGHSSGGLMVEFKPLEKFGVSPKVDLEVRDWKTNAVLWSHRYVHGWPNVASMPNGSEMILTWGINSDAAHEEIKAHPELKAEADALTKRKQGYLVEVLDKHTGIYQHGLVAGVRDWAGPQADERRAYVFGDFALIASEHESTAVYRLSTGARLGEVFGGVVALDVGSGLFATSNRSNELVIYDAATVRERKHFGYATRVRFAQFLPTRKQLVVLTADQKVHTINFDELQSGPTVAAATTP